MNIVKRGVQHFFDGTPFKIIYLILTLLSFNSFTAHTTFLTIFAYCVAALGGIVLLYRVIFLKRFIRTPNLLFLGLFLVSFIVSVLINYKYGIMENVQGFIWMALQYCILYACDDTKDTNFYKREFHILAGILSVYLIIGAMFSLYFMFTGEGGSILHSSEPVYYGFLWGRLWGIFTEPNNAAAAMCIGIFIAFYLFKVCKKIWVKIGSWCSIVLYASYILLSDSRTALICLVVGSAIITYLLIINPEKRNRKSIVTQIVAIALALVVGIGCFFGIYFGKKGYNLVQSSITSSQNESSEGNTTKKPNLEIGRAQDLANDFSNRRFDIWESGIEVFQAAPIFGVGFRNIVQAAQEKVPDTYIVNNDQGDFASFHNMFIDVLVSQGIVGIVIFLSFVILTLIWLIHLFTQKLKKDYIYLVTLFGIVMSIGVSAMVSPDVVYVNTQHAFMFWTFLGYLMHYAYKKRQERKALKMESSHNSYKISQPSEDKTG